jgi:hypothetical protein
MVLEYVSSNVLTFEKAMLATIKFSQYGNRMKLKFRSLTLFSGINHSVCPTYTKATN